MYRLFGMSESGRLYELSSKGWVEIFGANFPNLQDLRDFLKTTFIPPLPCGEILLDGYVGRVDAAGLIVETFSYCDVCNYCEG